jgi:hypothetical protein
MSTPRANRSPAPQRLAGGLEPRRIPYVALMKLTATCRRPSKRALRQTARPRPRVAPRCAHGAVAMSPSLSRAPQRREAQGASRPAAREGCVWYVRLPHPQSPSATVVATTARLESPQPCGLERRPPVFATPLLLVQHDERMGLTEVLLLARSNNGAMGQSSIRMDRGSAQQ